MRHAGTQTIETERLLLRRLLPEDAGAMYRNWASDPEVTKYLRWEPHQSPSETRALLAAWAELYANPDYYQWAITEKAGGDAFGAISLFDERLDSYDRRTAACWQAAGLDCSGGVWEPGYCLGRRWWGQGYATEALRAVVRYWFAETDGGWLACCHAAANPASGAVIRKAGFQPDGEGIRHKFDGTPVDCLFYHLTRAAYEQRYR